MNDDRCLGPTILAVATAAELSAAAEAIAKVLDMPSLRRGIADELKQSWPIGMAAVLAQILARGDGDALRAIGEALETRRAARQRAYAAVIGADAAQRAENTARVLAAISAPPNPPEDNSPSAG